MESADSIAQTLREKKSTYEFDFPEVFHRACQQPAVYEAKEREHIRRLLTLQSYVGKGIKAEFLEELTDATRALFQDAALCMMFRMLVQHYYNKITNLFVQHPKEASLELFNDRAMREYFYDWVFREFKRTEGIFIAKEELSEHLFREILEKDELVGLLRVFNSIEVEKFLYLCEQSVGSPGRRDIRESQATISFFASFPMMIKLVRGALQDVCMARGLAFREPKKTKGMVKKTKLLTLIWIRWMLNAR